MWDVTGIWPRHKHILSLCCSLCAGRFRFPVQLLCTTLFCLLFAILNITDNPNFELWDIFPQLMRWSIKYSNEELHLVGYISYTLALWYLENGPYVLDTDFFMCPMAMYWIQCPLLWRLQHMSPWLSLCTWRLGFRCSFHAQHYYYCASSFQSSITIGNPSFELWDNSLSLTDIVWQLGFWWVGVGYTFWCIIWRCI